MEQASITATGAIETFLVLLTAVQLVLDGLSQSLEGIIAPVPH